MAAKSYTKQYSRRELSFFCYQLSLMLKSGLTLSDGLGSMLEENPGDAVLRRIARQVEDRRTLKKALSDAGGFPQYMISMVEIGESSGKLDEVLSNLSDFYDREDRLRGRILSAIAYPALIIVMVAIVVSILVTKVMPIFSKVFNELGTQMSASAQLIMNVGQAVSQCMMVVVIFLAVIMVAILILSRTKRGMETLSGFASNFFLTRGISRKISVSRFASAFSMLMSSGYDMDSAFDLLPSIVTEHYIREKIKGVRDAIGRGVSAMEAFRDSGIFTGLYSGMVSVGFKTSNIVEVMRKIAEVYQEDTENSINGLVSLIEPVLVSVISVIIGVILVSVMLPLIGIISSIG